MIIPLSSFSALEFWLNTAPYNSHSELSLNGRSLIALPETYQLETEHVIIRELSNEYLLSMPLIAMAGSAKGRCSSDFLRCYVRSSCHPEKAFLQIDDCLYVSCPELCFLQLAQILSFPKLIVAGNNLCAQFGRNENRKYLQEHRYPIASADSIRSFLSLSDGATGIKKARRASRYILDHSNSPMESKLAAAVVLPLSLGGPGFPEPVLNKMIHLSSEGANLLQMETCCSDIVWEEDRVILEYDSNQNHLSKEQHSFDKRKYSALTMSGYKVLTVTPDQICNFQSVETLFENLRVLLHVKSRKKDWDRYREKRWETVHEIFFSSNKTGYRIYW